MYQLRFRENRNTDALALEVVHEGVSADIADLAPTDGIFATIVDTRFEVGDEVVKNGRKRE
jgi:hypothetical protein